MTRQNRHRIAVPALIAALSASTAQARLGGDESTVSGDRVAVHAQQRTTLTQQYDVHELTTAAGVVVREYVARGRVFALTWQGATMPDLPTLLGDYFSAYSNAATALPRLALRRHVYVQSNDLVVHSDGRMRAFSGRAYVPSLVPAAVNADELP